ncbi:class I adenylate-forming enzyme family protein [Noviherbaspirillum sedimenti]|uniref:Long-chain fatty acid--CoA ligase n=1 Tax=Noviherbaspirillum sedimenti TaxID=2320865 RepID=A0A3A3G2D5_9BURK|nr:fatty acid--CoA ligase family protein [Noviherbaspirillum sedimenti]RJG00642.1 long-chain fatty acid--CoA ligase [Noviherbaspirillum sedimenti]
MNIAQRIDKVLSLSPDTWAIEYRDRRLLWRDIRGVKNELGRLLDDHKIDPAFSVGLLARNHSCLAAAYVALLGLERGVTLLNPMRPAHQIAQEVADLRLACLIGLEEDFSDQISAAAQAAGTALIALGDSGTALQTKLVLAGRTGIEFRRCDKNTIIEIQTSGTTGAPKRIAISRRTLEGSLQSGVRNANGEADAAELTVKRSPTLMFGPLVHTSGTFGLLMSVFEARPTVLFEKFDAMEFARKLSAHRAKFAALPPTALRMLLDSDATPADLASLSAVRSGTAPLPIETQERFENKFGVPVLTNYGATEFLGTVAGWSLNEYKEWGKTKRGSVGRANAGVELRIVDPATFAPLEQDQVGILEARVARLDGGKSWVRTSDLARIDKDGFLYIAGRADDAIIRGGFKIMAEKVANALRLHPYVMDAIVLGVADERLGQVPVALIERRPGADPVAPVDLGIFARQHLVPYEVPARFVFVDKLPRTVSDKISRPEALRLLEAHGAA